MMTATMSAIIDDLQAAFEIERRFERAYRLSSADFYHLYRQGLLDDGERLEDFTMWAAYHEIALERERALQQLAQQTDFASSNLESLYAEFDKNDQLLAEAGIEEYHAGLLADDLQ